MLSCLTHYERQLKVMRVSEVDTCGQVGVCMVAPRLTHGCTLRVEVAARFASVFNLTP